MTLLFLVPLALAAESASATIDRCRAAHADDPAAHVVCLEDALRTRPAEAPDQVGLDQVKARERIQGDVPTPVSNVEIVDISYDVRGFGTFRTADGQVWRETETGKRKPRLLPDRKYAARIEHGLLGGYRMYVESITWMFKVERLE